MQYLRGTINLSLVLQADNIKNIKWWVDGAFGIHPDLRIHTDHLIDLPSQTELIDQRSFRNCRLHKNGRGTYNHSSRIEYGNNFKPT